MQIADQLGMLGLALLFYYHLVGSLSVPRKILLWGVLVPLRFAVAVASGGIGPIIHCFLPFAGTYWIARHKWPWKTVLFFALFTIPIQGVKGEYRAVAWGAADLGLVEKVQLYYQLVSDGFRNNDDFLVTSAQSTVRRVNQVTTLCLVMDLTPALIPYWGGQTYVDLYWMFIPRFLYPNKPQKVMGQEFGHRYGVLGKFDRSTSFNFPQIVELYANFGPWGVLGGMFVIGLLLRVLHYVLSDPSSGPMGRLFAAVIYGSVCNIESDFSLVFGGLALNIVGVFIVLKILNAKRIHLPLDMLRFR